MKAELVPENGDPPIPIVRDVTVVGRHEGCDVVISHPSLSKRHCVFVKTDGLLVLRDLATTNGTKVKGQRVRWAALLPEDRISLGGYKMRVYLGSDEMPSPSEQRLGRSRSVELVRPSQTPPRLVASFPEPSSDVVATAGSPIPNSAGPNGQEPTPAGAAPPGPGIEFELVDDDDDDEIIDLD
jgi:pSer/pThr/pTyr-binding forkhead associated (FHA) protein